MTRCTTAGPSGPDGPDGCCVIPIPTSRGSSRRVNRMIERLPGASCYLEIGLYLGATFDTIRAGNRVGVDPHPRFDVSRLPSGTSVFVGTSDDFFGALPADELFDVVFVDGLHHFDQAYRDVVNSFRHLTPGGMLLVDDVVPFDEISAMHDWAAASERRRAVGDPANSWNGDVFATVKVLVDHHPSIRLRTILGSGNPQTVLWRSDESEMRPIGDDCWRVTRRSAIATSSRMACRTGSLLVQRTRSSTRRSLPARLGGRRNRRRKTSPIRSAGQPREQLDPPIRHLRPAELGGVRRAGPRVVSLSAAARLDASRSTTRTPGISARGEHPNGTDEMVLTDRRAVGVSADLFVVAQINAPRSLASTRLACTVVRPDPLSCS